MGGNPSHRANPTHRERPRESGCVEAITAPIVRAEENESDAHIHMKKIVTRSLAHLYPDTEVRFQSIRRRADIVVRHPDIDKPIIIECQHSKMQLREYEARRDDYAHCGYLLWVFERRVVDPSGPIDIGFRRELGGAYCIPKVAYAEFKKQGFIHVLEGDDLQLVGAEEIIETRYVRWEDRFEEKRHIQVTGVYPTFPPLTIVLRGGMYPRLVSR